MLLALAGASVGSVLWSSCRLRLVKTVGEKGPEVGQFDGPRHIAALPTGGVCLVDGLNQRVQVLDVDGECVRCIDGMKTPTGVAIEGDTLWWVESTGAHRVKRLTLSHRSMSTAADAAVGRQVVDVQRPWAARATAAGGLGFAQGELHDPSCLCVIGELLLVAESGNHRISVFDKTSLEFVRHIAGADPDDEESEWYDGGSGEGELDQPCGLAVHEDEVFVCDTWNHRVSVFALDDGRYLRSFGQRGSAPGDMTYPVAIVVHEGLLYVTERTGKRLQVLTLQGEPVDDIAAPCGGWLYGCCVDATGNLWISSSSSHKVHLLKTSQSDVGA